jgi:hypothetical protein
MFCDGLRNTCPQAVRITNIPISNEIKIPCFYKTGRLSPQNESPPFDTILKEFNPIFALATYFSTMYLNTIQAKVMLFSHLSCYFISLKSKHRTKLVKPNLGDETSLWHQLC